MPHSLRQTITSLVPNVSPDDVTYFLSHVSRRELAAREILINEGDICDFVAYVETGVLRTFLQKDGRELNTEFFLDNTFASAFTSYLQHSITQLTVQALEPCIIFIIPKALLDEMYLRDPNWYALGKYMFETEFIKKCKRESSFLKDDARTRYLSLLAQYPTLEERVPLNHIASYLGIQPETLSRIRAEKINAS